MEDARLAAHSDRAERNTDDCDGGRLVSTGTHFVCEAAVRGVDAVEVAWDGPRRLPTHVGSGVDDPVEAQAWHDGVWRRGHELSRALQLH